MARKNCNIFEHIKSFLTYFPHHLSPNSSEQIKSTRTIYCPPVIEIQESNLIAFAVLLAFLNQTLVFSCETSGCNTTGSNKFPPASFTAINNKNAGYVGTLYCS